MHAIVKIKSILPTETIIHVTKVLAYANTSSVTTTFHNELCDLPQKEERYIISCLQINNFNSERFLRNTKRTQTEIKKTATIAHLTTLWILKQPYVTQGLFELIKSC